MSPTRRRARGVPERRDSEAARYKRAAEAALSQIDVCIRYLQRLQKRQLATRLARNRASIARLLEEPPRSTRRRRASGRGSRKRSRGAAK